MAANDEDESTGVIVGVLAGIALAVIAVTFSGGSKVAQQPVKQVAEQAEIAPVGDALAKVYFGVGGAKLNDADLGIVGLTRDALAGKDSAIVLLSGFHDTSGDPARNAELAKLRAVAVRDALVAGGVAPERIKFRKPESTVGDGSAEEGRRVEIRVQ